MTAKYPLGCLSLVYETGVTSGGYAKIAYDINGGWSYGPMQLASKQGSMASFINYLKRKNSPYYERVIAIGGNAGATAGDDIFKQGWKALAQEYGFCLELDGYKLDAYVREAERIAKLHGIDFDNQEVSREVLISTVIQHGEGGGGARVIDKAIKRISNFDPSDQAAFLNAVYAERGKVNENGVLAYFTKEVVGQRGVQNRLRYWEPSDAFDMLSGKPLLGASRKEMSEWAIKYSVNFVPTDKNGKALVARPTSQAKPREQEKATEPTPKPEDKPAVVIEKGTTKEEAAKSGKSIKIG